MSDITGSSNSLVAELRAAHAEYAATQTFPDQATSLYSMAADALEGRSTYRQCMCPDTVCVKDALNIGVVCKRAEFEPCARRTIHGHNADGSEQDVTVCVTCGRPEDESPTPPPSAAHQAAEFKVGDAVNYMGVPTEIVGVNILYTLAGGTKAAPQMLSKRPTATKESAQ